MGHYLSEMGPRTSDSNYYAERERYIFCAASRDLFFDKSPYKKGDFIKGVVVDIRKGLNKETLEMFFSHYRKGPFLIHWTCTDDERTKSLSLVTSAGWILSNRYDYRFFKPVSAREREQFAKEYLRAKKKFKSNPFTSWKSWPQQSIF